ncbi:phf isoform b [Nannochloropsis oceanica]
MQLWDNVPEHHQGLPNPASLSRCHRSEAARSYGTLPFQFNRLFFSPNAGDCRFGNRNLKLVHRDPHVYEIADFLSETEYGHLEQVIEQHLGKFSNSYTDEDVDAQVVSGSRTSAFISLRKGGGSKMRSIESRASEIVGLAPENVEPLQLGHTVFPKLEGGRFSVQPKRLKALLWCNVLPNGAPDPRLIHRADPVREEGHLKFGINIWITDKNLGALTLSTTHGVILDHNKVIPGKRTILAMIDPPCHVCKSRDRQQFLKACDNCDISYHRYCLLPEARPPPHNGPRRFWACPLCPGKRPRPGDFCEVCDGGDREHLIVLCDTCERGFHTTCLGMRKVPKESYYCDLCQAKREAKTRADKARRDGACQACGGVEEPHRILLCDGCDGEWHLACVGLKRVPRKDWYCRECAKEMKRRKKKICKEEGRE